MLHDTHVHLEMLLQKLEMLYLSDRESFDPSANYSFSPKVLGDLLAQHDFVVQATTSTQNFLLSYKLFAAHPKVKFLIGSHPEIVDGAFDVRHYLEQQKELLQAHGFLRSNLARELELVQSGGLGIENDKLKTTSSSPLLRGVSPSGDGGLMAQTNINDVEFAGVSIPPNPLERGRGKTELASFSNPPTLRTTLDKGELSPSPQQATLSAFGPLGNLERGEQEFNQKKILGLGECGLDYHYTQDKDIIRKQWELFENQASLASYLDVSFIIHTRNSFADAFAILQQFPQLRDKFVFHCFSEGVVELEQVLTFGGYISVGGVLTFKNADKLRQVVEACPIDRLLVETDLPFLAPTPHRGKVCLPEYIDLVAQKIGEVKNISKEEVWTQLTENALGFFD